MPKIFSVSGSLLLAICFFLPMVRACDEDISPFSRVKEISSHALRGDLESIPGFIGTFVPHLFGLLVLSSVIILMGKRRVTKVVRISHWGILFLGYILNICVIIAPLFNSWPIRIDMQKEHDTIPLAYVFLAVVYFTLIPITIIRALRKQREPQSPLIIITVIQKILALMSFLWFFYWLLGFRADALYGLYVALASCILIYLGTPLFTVLPENKQLGVPDEEIQKAKEK